MTFPTKSIILSVQDNDHCKRLKDPADSQLFHMEAYLPFSEAVKLERGNANVRPASERKKPFKDMIQTVENDPASFHVKNRGITYLCDRFEYENAKSQLRLTVPIVSTDEASDLDNGGPRFGIADGGHTFEVICQTVARLNELKDQEGWLEPFVRVHFMAGNSVEQTELEQVVEALNTSSQVQQYTLDEYQNKFEELKLALSKGGFNTELIAFRENEEKEWDVREVVQRMACFLKERWKTTQPASMYRSRGKALDLYTSETTREEFRRLYDVAADIITLPEFVQSEFSQGDSVKGRRFGKLKGVKALKKSYTRPGTNFPTDHLMDLAASLPIAAAFRELLELKGDRYQWRLDPKRAFRRCAEDLYKTLATKNRSAKSVNNLGSDSEYWTQTANIVLRAKDEMTAGN
jgi:hypothetical protein